ncbi:hypothetical protein [Streptomyces lasiicapitis]|uniref:hypothetical protein n=1 Tax=Streptomyces lasiicapitis TaxID=1923961 RepID=UPI00369D94CC
MTTTFTAEPGRRILFTGYGGTDIAHPGVITGIADDGALLVRLDGQRSNLKICPERLPASKRLTLLEEAGPVPPLPMGRFVPTAADFSGAWEGVPVCEFEDGDIVVLTGDPGRADSALAVYCRDMDMDREYLPAMEPRWVVFEWQPEGAECPWFMTFADAGDDMAVRIHYVRA